MADDQLDQPESDGFHLVVPFVVCRSQGGPYDDDAFAAGFHAAQISYSLKVAAAVGATSLRFTTRTDLVKQLDLIAMDRGFTMTTTGVEETEDHPAMPEWTFVTFEAS